MEIRLLVRNQIDKYLENIVAKIFEKKDFIEDLENFKCIVKPKFEEMKIKKKKSSYVEIGKS